jgi:hypothetical protein
MTEKIFVGDNDIATIVCPNCNASKDEDVSKYKGLSKAVRLKVTCGCGTVYSVFLERRHAYRKTTELAGKYAYRPEGARAVAGVMIVMDISRGGVKLFLKTMPDIKVGDKLDVEFYLNDNQRTLIRKEVLVRGVKDALINAEFTSMDTSDPADKALGFYLF